MARVTSGEAEVYTFALTGGDGARTLGFARRFVPPGAGPRHPHVLCLLSAHPWFSLFASLLKALEPFAFPLAPSPVLTRASPLAAALVSLASQPAPAPGQVLPPPPLAGGLGLPTLRAPFDRGVGPANADVFFAPLLWRVPLAAALNLFAALLAERRIIILASDLSALSGAVHAAAAMLYPLAWQHIYLPILPASLLDYLSAPMPFLVGLPACLEPAMRTQPMEEVVLLNLDTGVIECFAEDLALLPRTSGGRLAAELKAAIESRVHSDKAVSDALRTFFLSTLGDHRRFVHRAPDRPRDARASLNGAAPPNAQQPAALPALPPTPPHALLLGSGGGGGGGGDGADAAGGSHGEARRTPRVSFTTTLASAVSSALPSLSGASSNAAAMAAAAAGAGGFGGGGSGSGSGMHASSSQPSLSTLSGGAGFLALPATTVPPDALRSGSLWFDTGAYAAATR